MPVQADNHKQGIRRVENYLHAIGIGKNLWRFFMLISEGVLEIKLAKVKMKMEFQSESDGAPL